MRRMAVLLAGVAALLSGIGAAPRAGAETPQDRFRALLEQKRSLQRTNALLAQEAKLAATRSPYLLLDLDAGRMEFRVRGKTLKVYSFDAIARDAWGLRRADAEAIWSALDAPLTVLEKQGGHPELVPPDPEAGRETGLLYSDPNQLAAQTGATPVRTDAGLLGVDAPTEYYIRLKENAIFHIRGRDARTFRQKAAARLSRAAGLVRAALASWWAGAGSTAAAKKPALALYLITDPETARRLHHSLLPGERIFIVPPPPPPFVLVAASGTRRAGSASAAPAPGRR